MKTKIRILSLLLVLVFGFTMLGACAKTGTDGTTRPQADPTPTKAPDKTDPPAEDPLKERVDLKYLVLLGRVFPDLQYIQEKVNEYMLDKWNTTIEIEAYPSAEYSQQLSIATQAQGRGFDLAYVRQRDGFAQYVASNAFAPLKDLLETYAPQAYAQVDDEYWHAVTFNDEIYALIPYKDLGLNFAYIYNQDLCDKFGVQVPEFNTILELIPFWRELNAKMKEDPELKDLPFGKALYRQQEIYPYEEFTPGVGANIPGKEYYKGMGSGEKVFNVYATEEYKEFCLGLNELVRDNIIAYDAPNYDADKALFNAGKLQTTSTGMGYITIEEDFYPFKTAMRSSNLTLKSTGYIQAALTAIMVNSPNKERAMMFWEWMCTDEQLATMLRFGIEGEHYKLDSNGRVDPREAPKNVGLPANEYPYYLWYGVQFGNMTAGKLPYICGPDWLDKLANVNNSAVKALNLGFTFNNESVVNETAAIANIIKEYDVITNLRGGLLSDEDTLQGIEEFNAKLKENGMDKIVAEVQKQRDEWAKGK